MSLREWDEFVECIQRRREQLAKKNDKRRLEILDWVLTKIPDGVNDALKRQAEDEKAMLTRERMRRYRNDICNKNTVVEKKNVSCRYYRNSDKNRCECGMDMDFCTKNCAYATNAIGSTKIGGNNGKRPSRKKRY